MKYRVSQHYMISEIGVRKVYFQGSPGPAVAQLSLFSFIKADQIASSPVQSCHVLCSNTWSSDSPDFHSLLYLFAELLAIDRYSCYAVYRNTQLIYFHAASQSMILFSDR